MDIFPKFSHLNRAVYDLQAIPKSNPETDFLRTHGDGIYAGIAEGVDRALLAAPTTTIPESSAPSDITSPSETDLHAPSLSAGDPGYIDDLMPDPNIPIISFKEVLQSEKSEPAVLKLELRTGAQPNDYLRDKDVPAHDRLCIDEMQEINSTGTTWALHDLLLCTLIDELWKMVENAQMGLREMPLFKEALAGFPYPWSTGISALLSNSDTAFVTDRSARKLLNASESERDKVAKRAGNTQTYPQLANHTLADSAAVQVDPNCRYVVSFQYQMANKGSATTPSRNVPQFSVIIWANICAISIQSSVRIDKEEEMALGVPEFLVPRSFTNFKFVRDSDEPTREEKRGQGFSERGGAKRKRGGHGGYCFDSFLPMNFLGISAGALISALSHGAKYTFSFFSCSAAAIGSQ
ncbi:hypothetical protein B0H13DRAFT_2392317 [Mycena leptocephala]|nr:hypothetical protein B0H13DRAFT_2392317 [Mycena leptocephala]